MLVVACLVMLTSLSPRVNTYSRGAPDSACSDNMQPRHGFDVQVRTLCYQRVQVSQVSQKV